MKKFLLPILIACLALGIFANSASAGYNPDHQSHEGACSTSTMSISNIVANWEYNNVLDKFAAKVGIHGADGPKYLLEQQLIHGTIAHNIVVKDYGCEESTGIVFQTHNRELKANEAVVLPTPKKYQKVACKQQGPGCKKKLVLVTKVFPISCGNITIYIKVKIPVYIWIREEKEEKPEKKHPHHKGHHPHCPCKKHKQPKPQKPTPPPAPSNTNNTNNTTNTTNTCNGNSTNNGNTTTNGVNSAGNCPTNVNVTVEQPPSCTSCSPPPCTTCTCTNSCTPPPTPECEHGSIYSPSLGKCVKNGEEGTENPTSNPAPGENHQDEGGVGSNECYWESAGPNPDGNGYHNSTDPVAPQYIHEGACPSGSEGAY